MPSNPAKGKRRKLRVSAPERSRLESAAQIEALLDAARELDAEAQQLQDRHAMVATLVFAGLRLGELVSLRWRDVDLAGGWITVMHAKTDAGARRVKIRRSSATS